MSFAAYFLFLFLHVVGTNGGYGGTIIGSHHHDAAAPAGGYGGTIIGHHATPGGGYGGTIIGKH